MKIIFPTVFFVTLVLTSCGTSENDPAAIDLASGQQFVALNEYGRGEEKKYQLKEMAENRSVPDLASAVRKMFLQCERIDRLTGERIALLEQLKMELLQDMGENVSVAGEKQVLQSKYDRKDPLRPGMFNLANATAADKTDFIGFDGGKGKEIYEDALRFRGQLAEAVATYTTRHGDRFSFRDPVIRTYADYKDLYDKLEKAIGSSNVAVDDHEALKMIYAGLSRTDDQWKNLFHADCSWITAFQLLSMQQYEALRARADALSLIRARVGGEDYGFNRITPIAAGPEYVKAGSEFDFEVFVAAFDSYQQPVVTIDGGPAHLFEVRDGKAHIRARAPGSPCEMTLAGKIMVVSKSGIPKTMLWQKTIVVGE